MRMICTALALLVPAPHGAWMRATFSRRQVNRTEYHPQPLVARWVVQSNRNRTFSSADYYEGTFSKALPRIPNVPTLLETRRQLLAESFRSSADRPFHLPPFRGGVIPSTLIQTTWAGHRRPFIRCPSATCFFQIIRVVARPPQREPQRHSTRAPIIELADGGSDFLVSSFVRRIATIRSPLPVVFSLVPRSAIYREGDGARNACSLHLVLSPHWSNESALV